MNKLKKIIIMAGGSGGHIFPGLAIACDLMNYGYQVVWLGAKDNVEFELISKFDIDIKLTNIKGLYNQKLITKMTMLWLVCTSVYQALKIMKFWKPDIALGMGGYVSGPGGIAAWICRVPLFIHEQNRIIGLTNYYLSFFAKKVMYGFPNLSKKGDFVGNPVRKDILSIPEPKLRWSNRNGPIRVLVLGGSKGADILNKTLPEIARQLPNKLIIWHQVGVQNVEYVTHAYQKNKQQVYKVMPFIFNIEKAYEWADLLISRAGALTISEVAIVGLPTIFVPFMHHKDYHQYWNAMLLVKVGSAIIIEQKEFTANYVSSILRSWDRKILLDMANRARILAMPDATQKITQKLIEYLDK